MIRLLWLALATLFLIAQPARADELRPGYLEFTQKSAADWTLVWKAPMRGGVTPATQPILPKGCTAKGEPQRALGEMAMISTFAVTCTEAVAGSTHRPLQFLRRANRCAGARRAAGPPGAGAAPDRMLPLRSKSPQSPTRGKSRAPIS